MPTFAEIVQGPQTEPVTLAELKTWVRVDSDLTADDSLLTDEIQAAREDAETYCRRGLITQQLRLVCDRFPSPMAGKLNEYWIGQQWAAAGMGGVSKFAPTDRSGYGIVLPWSPLQTVDSITYVDPTGATQTLASNKYIVDKVSEPCRIMPAFGCVWPTTLQQPNSVTVLYTVGYGANGTFVPAGIKRWIKIRAATTYRNREEVAILGRGKVELLPYVDTLLNPHRVVTV